MNSRQCWGVGDFESILHWIFWCAQTKTSILQLLPLCETPPGNNCPYSAVSAFAFDPVFIAVEEMEDVKNSPELRHYISSAQDQIALWRKSKTAPYFAVKELKFKILWLAFEHFLKTEQAGNSARFEKFLNYSKQNAHWLSDYSVFRAIKDIKGWSSWTQWEDGLKNHDEKTLAQFRKNHSKQILFFEYVQWVADVQWEKVRRFAREKNVLLFGDLPFSLNQESPDAWGNQTIFDISLEAGAPPDEFSSSGQKWGIPAYNWRNLEDSDFSWWRKRVRRAAQTYDLFRLDHVVGFFRTWVIAQDRSKKAGFDLPDEGEQKKRGERFLKMVISECGKAFPVAEDLGVIPPFVRETLVKLGIPGYKVMRWEKDGGTFREPKNYPPISIAAISTHDTDMLKDWWGTLPNAEKSGFWEMACGKSPLPQDFSEVSRAVLRRILNSGSNIVILTMQDILETSERINTPGTLSADNWAYKFPIAVEDIGNCAFAEKISRYKNLIGESKRI